MSGLLLGREEELEAAERFLGLMAGGAAALVLAGEAGMGKTVVWREVLARAERRSYRVLCCGGAELEAKLSYAALCDLLGDVEEEALACLPAPQRSALEIVLLRAGAPGPPPDQRVVCTALVSLLSTLSRCSPVLVAVDDVQWVDRSSLRALQFAARRVQRSDVGFLLTVRTPTELSLPRDLERSLGQERVLRQDVGPLSVGVLHGLIDGRLGRTLGRPALVRVHRLTGGNPFFALEVASALLAAGAPAPGGPLPVPTDLRELVLRRMRRLPPETRQTLFVTAAMSDVTLDALAGAGEVSHARVTQRLAPALSAGVVAVEAGRVRFSHPLFASAVYAAVAPGERRHWHRRLATVASEPEQCARHQALGAEGPDATAAGALDAAARSARARGAPDAAAELCELAIGLTPADRGAQRHARRTAAAEHHFRAGDLDRAGVLLEEALAEASPGPARARSLLLLSVLRHQQNSFPDALSLLTQALEEARDDRRVAAEIGTHLAFVRVASGDFAGAEAPARSAVEHLRGAEEPALLAQALAVGAMVDFMLGRGLDRAAVERALALEDRDRHVLGLMRPSLIAACLDFYSGDLTSARARLAALRERVIERGEESDLPYIATNLAWLECCSGNLIAAQRHAREALESAAQIGSESLHGYALAFEALVAAYQGEESTARSTAHEALAASERTGLTVGSLWALWALAVLDLSLGDAEAAARALAPLTQAIEEEGLSEPIRAFFLPDAIEALIAMGRLDRAERLIVMLEECGRRLERPWALAPAGRCRGLLLAARGEHGAAVGVLERALCDHDRLSMPVERARTLLALGMVQRRKGRRRDAQATLRQALGIFEEVGATLWARRTRGELRGTGGRPASSQELTAAEERVARLAAGGMTNREVAVALFISPKTVEANLARVYRKLGIHSRAELGARLAPRAGPDQEVSRRERPGVPNGVM